jgi:S-phase kinase-associated protein 1
MTRAAAFLSNVLRTCSEDCDGGTTLDDEEIVRIPVSAINHETMLKVAEFQERYSGGGGADPDDQDKRDEAVRWNSAYVQSLIGLGGANSLIYDVMSAANFLDSPKLLDVLCVAVADLVRDRTPDQIRSMLNILSDFTDEEQASVDRNCAWTDDVF